MYSYFIFGQKLLADELIFRWILQLKYHKLLVTLLQIERCISNLLLLYACDCI